MKKPLLPGLALCCLSFALPAQCPVFFNCPGGLFQSCDFSVNNPLLWNESYWQDAAHSTQDLCEGPVALTISLRDTCDNLGLQVLEIWGRDRAGNADYCETYILIQDNFQVCD
jgi:hypothetical protein